MDKVMQGYQENKDIVMSATTLVVLGLVVLALRPEMIPSFIPKDLTVKFVYLLLFAMVVYHLYNLGMAIKDKVKKEPEVPEVSST